MVFTRKKNYSRHTPGSDEDIREREIRRRYGKASVLEKSVEGIDGQIGSHLSWVFKCVSILALVAYAIITVQKWPDTRSDTYREIANSKLNNIDPLKRDADPYLLEFVFKTYWCQMPKGKDTEKAKECRKRAFEGRDYGGITIDDMAQRSLALTVCRRDSERLGVWSARGECIPTVNRADARNYLVHSDIFLNGHPEFRILIDDDDGTHYLAPRSFNDFRKYIRSFYSWVSLHYNSYIPFVFFAGCYFVLFLINVSCRLTDQSHSLYRGFAGLFWLFFIGWLAMLFTGDYFVTYDQKIENINAALKANAIPGKPSGNYYPMVVTIFPKPPSPWYLYMPVAVVANLSLVMFFTLVYGVFRYCLVHLFGGIYHMFVPSQVTVAHSTKAHTVSAEESVKARAVAEIKRDRAGVYKDENQTHEDKHDKVVGMSKKPIDEDGNEIPDGEERSHTYPDFTVRHPVDPDIKKRWRWMPNFFLSGAMRSNKRLSEDRADLKRKLIDEADANIEFAESQVKTYIHNENYESISETIKEEKQRLIEEREYYSRKNEFEHRNRMLELDRGIAKLDIEEGRIDKDVKEIHRKELDVASKEKEHKLRHREKDVTVSALPKPPKLSEQERRHKESDQMNNELLKEKQKLKSKEEFFEEHFHDDPDTLSRLKSAAKQEYLNGINSIHDKYVAKN